MLTAFAEDEPEPGFQGGRRRGPPIAAARDQDDRRGCRPASELVVKLLFLMQSPMRRLVTVLNGPVRNLAGVVEQIAEQKSKSRPARSRPPSAEVTNCYQEGE